LTEGDKTVPKQDIVEIFEQAESRQLTLPEAVNRFLMRAETAAISTDREEFVGAAAKHFKKDKKEVDDVLGTQVDKRIQSLTEHANRLRALAAGK
jgi:hypothetical protein